MIQKIKPFFETSSNMKKKGCRINISRLCGDSFMSHKFGHRGCLCLIKLLINSHLYRSCRNKTDLSKEFSLIFIPSAKGNGIPHQNRRCKDVHCAGKNYNCSVHYSLHVKQQKRTRFVAVFFFAKNQLFPPLLSPVLPKRSNIS